MKLRTLFKIGILFAAFSVTQLYAATFEQVYFQAVLSDQIFKQDEANWRAQQQNLPIARSQYLPQLNVTGLAARIYEEQLPESFLNFVNTTGLSNSFRYEVTLSQPIFDAAVWHAIQGAHADVKAATATYLYDTQDLIVRTAQAYFNVLKAYEKLQFTLANKRAVYQQLVTAQQQFQVGLIAITGVYDAQSRYDQTVADEITDRNNLNNQLENLRVITGIHYRSLKGLAQRVPLFAPIPNNINEWVCIAMKQNYSLRAQEFSLQSALQNVKQQSAGHLPVFSLEGKWQQVRNTDFDNSPNLGIDHGELGVAVNFPILEGGLVVAQTKQARFQYAQQSGKVEYTRRSVENDARQAFLGVISGMSQIRADKQAIISAVNALKATKAGYVVGTRTMVDVLNDISALYEKEKKYADDQYDYIFEIISLREAAGTLSLRDVLQVSNWLKKTLIFPKPPVSYGDKYDVSKRVTAELHRTMKVLKRTAPTIDMPLPPTDLDNQSLKKGHKKDSPGIQFYQPPPGLNGYIPYNLDEMESQPDQQKLNNQSIHIIDHKQQAKNIQKQKKQIIRKAAILHHKTPKRNAPKLAQPILPPPENTHHW